MFKNFAENLWKTPTTFEWVILSDSKIIFRASKVKDIKLKDKRWTNENTNWLIRQFLPKWTDFETLTEKELQKYVVLINNRPKERLWFLTPYEVL